jgi:hypothetical protein
MRNVSRGMTAAAVCIAGMLVVLTQASCEQHKPTQAPGIGPAIREMAVRAEPRLRGQNLRFSGTVLGVGDGCACLKVCNGAGENCTSCVCSPANCGTCD